MNISAKKRFIAGAVCPRCGAMDRIVMYREQEADFRECVACGFRDQLRIQPPVREPTTRVNLTPEQRLAEVQPVRIIGGASKSPPKSE